MDRPPQAAEPTARITDLKKNALDDGPGIRSVVFFKGCPLRCTWCQNPEAIAPSRELQVTAARCTACGACVSGCPEGSATPGRDAQTREFCRVCGSCAEACPSGARRIVGDDVGLDDLITRLARDLPFYRRSGGGVTLSGGEPTLHMGFASALASALADRGIPVLLETCGHFHWEPFERTMLPNLERIYVDVKLQDPQAHRLSTGVNNHRIQENLERLHGATGPAEVLPRIPLVPGITDTVENLESIAERLARIGYRDVALLPYNSLWLSKCHALGLPSSDLPKEGQSREDLHRCEEPFRTRGLELR